MDVQGTAVVRPWIEAAGITFPALVDTSGVLADAFGMLVVRSVLLFDEDGVLAAPILRIEVDDDERLVGELVSWLEGTGPVPAVDEESQGAMAMTTPAMATGIAWYRIAEMALRRGDREAAVMALDEAWDRLPENLQIRKQRWALRAPDRFYAGEIDLEWQQRQRELGV